MFKSLRLILTLALLSVVAHPSVAQMVVSGNFNEDLEFTFSLDESAVVDGVRQTEPPADCETGFTIRARDALGLSSSVATVVVALAAGETLIAKFHFDEFAVTGAAHVILTVSDVHRSGPCRLLRPFGRLVAEDGTTRSGGVGLFEELKDILQDFK